MEYSQVKEYRVAGQAAIYLSVNKGEKIIVTSDDGVQPCELLVLSGDANQDLFSSKIVKEFAKATRQQLQEAGSASQKMKEDFSKWGVTTHHLEAAYCFPSDQLPSFTAPQNMEMVLIAAGTKMQIDSNASTTELKVVRYYAGEPGLPEPLAEPVKEIRVPHSSARAYEVKAGEWIQIIDVEGRQCSDFIAFDKAALEAGQEVLIDGTATRTSMGLVTPHPGLFSRICDTRQLTMLEVVQDTVGRHDSFLFACTPKYYEDQGYLGHVNCTDNFNKALKPYGISARTGWPAINFFFNTHTKECGAISFAEPWSQAGDYVLLKANRDLVCASSACPDDIDPANGWNPTDIHVRIYSKEESFSRSIAYRTLPGELSRMTKETGFHTRTSQLTKRFTEYHGYWVASEYEGWGLTAEYLACREKVAMIDLTPLRKFEVLGPDAEVFLQYALTRNVRRLSVGEIVYSALCNKTGGMIDDGTLFKMGDQAFRWICGDPYTGIWLRELAEKTQHKVKVLSSTDQIHNVAVQGPMSRKLLNEVIWTPESQTSIEQLAWFHFTIARVGGPQGIPVMVSRTGYTGELGFEVWCHPDDAALLWDTLWEKGQTYGIAPLGFDALDRLRIEAGLIFAEHEFNHETNPFEAGIGFTVALKTNEEDFVGRAAIERQSPESRHKLMGLKLGSNETVHHGDYIYDGRFPVGVITSATFSPLIKQQIALCRLAPEYAEVGLELEVGQLDGLQKRLPATVVSLPFYDPGRTKVRS